MATNLSDLNANFYNLKKVATTFISEFDHLFRTNVHGESDLSYYQFTRNELCAIREWFQFNCLFIEFIGKIQVKELLELDPPSLFYMYFVSCNTKNELILMLKKIDLK